MAFRFQCRNCGDHFERKNSRPAWFCGHACKAIYYGTAHMQTAEARAKRGDKRRGTGRRDGYVKRGGRHEHRVVMEQKIGRPLTSEELVHHEDEVKSHNAPGNLKLTDRSEHARIHFTGRKRPPAANCKQGHPFTPSTTRVDSKGFRRCVICIQKYDREWKRAKRREKREMRNANSSPGGV